MIQVVKRLLLIITIISLLLIPQAAATAGEPDFESLLRQARELSRDGMHEDAFDVLMKAALYATNEQRPALHLARGEVHAAIGEIIEAITEFDAAVNLAAGDNCMRVNRALFYESIGENGAALSDAETAIEAGCKTTGLTALRGRLYMWQSDYVNAIESFSDLFLLDEYRFEAMKNTGLAYMILGVPDTARQYLVEVYRQDPDDRMVNSWLGDVYSMTGDFERSFVYYRKAIELDPEHTIAANNYGFTLYLAGRVQEALELFESEVEADPKVYTLCNMMEINLGLENYQQAYRYGGLCLAAFSKEPAHAEYERFYLKAVSRAMKVLMTDRQQMHHLTQLDLSYQHEEAGEMVDALAAALVSLMIEPANAAAQLQAGRLYSLLGDSVKASSFLNLASSLSGKNSDASMEAISFIHENTLSVSGVPVKLPARFRGKALQ